MNQRPDAGPGRAMSNVHDWANAERPLQGGVAPLRRDDPDSVIRDASFAVGHPSLVHAPDCAERSVRLRQGKSLGGAQRPGPFADNLAPILASPITLSVGRDT